MNEEIYFLDTYALFEIVAGNESYKRYEPLLTITTIFNLAEFNYSLKKKVDEKSADKQTEAFSKILVEVTIEDIKKAMSLRGKYKKMSAPDVIGYTVAKRLKAKFVTGDEDFRDLPNVELIKR